MSINHQYQQAISSYIGRLMRDYFGKGPESIFVSVGHTLITIYLRNFLTPVERILLEQNHEPIVHQLRDKLMQNMIPEIKNYIEMVAGIKPHEFYYDWEFNNKSGMMVGICSEPFQDGSMIDVAYAGKDELEAEIVRISQEAQKAPVEIYSYEINPRTLVVIRVGTLVPIEKELIRLGHGELLKGVKRSVEKSFLHNNSSFENILNKKVMDIFVNWNFESDKSIILFMLDAKA